MRQTFIPDEAQQKVIAAEGGYHLVLAPPGCGKTQILAERIYRAKAEGIALTDMLCLTFTNRAARGMAERLSEQLADEDLAQLFVGNVHRYCSKFLFDNALIRSETGIIDDDDAVSILARYRDDDERQVADDMRKRNEYHQIIFFSHFMQQLRNGHEKAIRMHPEAVTAEDITALRKIAEVQRVDFTLEMMIDVYDHVDAYRDMARGDGYDIASQRLIFNLLRKMEQAQAYQRYKTDTRLLDFEDLLILTYDALKADTVGRFRRYRWIQIDEVQDLNPMQLSIIDLLTQPEDSTVMYLGDEQQAIFSFMGAKMSTLEMLKQRCQKHLHRLFTNHRSPRYLLEVLNEYASKQLHIDAALLPVAHNDDAASPDSLTLLASSTIETEYLEVAHCVGKWFLHSDRETIAVVVNSNHDADKVSQALDEILVPHFKVSGVDLFSMPEVKFLLAHFNVMQNEYNFLAWSRLMLGLGIYRTAASARQFVRDVMERAMLPTDFLKSFGQSTYVQQFCESYNQGDIVVFDTETTGLDTANDDIVQIAAVKMRAGEVVPGSALNIFMHTDRPIPLKLGDLDNPLIEELKHQKVVSRAEGLQQFMDYARGHVLVGHNVNFDYSILSANLQRDLPDTRLEQQCPVAFDTLRLAHLLEPNRLSYKLKNLLATLNLEGENSHLADADVAATCSLIKYCYAKGTDAVARQQEFFAQEKYQHTINQFQQQYKTLYEHTRQRLRDVAVAGEEPIFVSELRAIYERLRTLELIPEIEKIDHLFNYLSSEVFALEPTLTLREQIHRHMVEINTLKEADLCSARSMTERVFVSTVHKAKGLEFDNVVVFDAVDGRYPNYYTRNNPLAVAEDARKFYVALSRSKQRICIAHSLSARAYDGTPRPRNLSPFVTPILRFFSS